MEEFRVIFMLRALSDLEKIREYVAADSPENAAKFIDRVLDQIEQLKLTPHRSLAQHTDSRLRHSVRVLVVAPYIVYFRAIDEQKVVRILHIRHGARRQPRRI